VSEQPALAQTREAFQIVSFRLGDEEYGLDISSVKEINRFVPITRIPKTVPYVEGVIDLRGALVTIVDLRTLFGMPARERDRDSRIMVVNVGTHRVGLVVDSVCEVLRCITADLADAPELAGGTSAHYVEHVVKHGDRLIILLKLEHIFFLALPSTPTALAAA
jgi:purine-binding chemotaxis protein CheW